MLDVFPRFADDPRRRPPEVPAEPMLTIRQPAGDERLVPVSDLVASEAAVDRTVDFHCVTTWSVLNQTWTGVPLRTWWASTIGPLQQTPFAVVVGLDGHRAVFVVDDLFADDVLLAWNLNGEPLDHRHGAPLRLVSPGQYGYKNVKHVAAIELHAERPVSTLGAKEHLRARVAEEERHSRWPAWLVRWPYRALVPPTAIAAERSGRQR
ncbi:molybdopterin-dependent oxidoreductase [Microbacterium xanthum]|uniref:molybdopterin-dependent oxidoreductase n=1 Tax=Microbacterium xanthum TaxID=3079794 RepID=UPI002AD239FD|nr:molybdopterin-dependent oxidoreductase [Microbacterium sp. KSW-48]MDZ8173103.1 molybdopterin-dependent oxidoreductase [Microbacterium sp. KSW-48]